MTWLKFLEDSMGRKTIPLRFRRSKVPLITFRLAGEEHYAIIDTGSETTMLSNQLKEHLKTREIEGNGALVAMNGRNEYSKITQGVCYAILQTEDKEQIQVVLGGLMYDLTTISTHFKHKNNEFIPIAAIIGGEFLKHYNARIDYKKKTLTIDEVAQ